MQLKCVTAYQGISSSLGRIHEVSENRRNFTIFPDEPKYK